MDVSVVNWVDDERMMLFCKMGVVGGVNDLTINNGSRNDTQKHCLIRSIMMTFQIDGNACTPTPVASSWRGDITYEELA